MLTCPSREHRPERMVSGAPSGSLLSEPKAGVGDPPLLHPLLSASLLGFSVLPGPCFLLSRCTHVDTHTHTHSHAHSHTPHLREAGLPSAQVRVSEGGQGAAACRAGGCSTPWGHDFPGASLSILTSAQLFPQGLLWGLWCPWPQAEPKGAGKAVRKRRRSLGGRGGGWRRQGWGSVDSLAEATDPLQVNCAPPLVPQQAPPGDWREGGGWWDG